MRCIAYCTSTAFDVPNLFSHLKTHFSSVRRFREVVSIHYAAEDIAHTEGEVFFFPYGALVCWGLTEHHEQQILQLIQPFEQQRVEPIETDDLSYAYGEALRIEEDEILLPSHELEIKLAISHGFAQSVKLQVFEQTVQKTIHWTRDIPQLLAEKGSIRFSRKEIRRRIGRLFIDRSSINLHQELLDTPEFFWEHTDLEPMYALTAHYFDRERRVNVLNQRLLVIQELLDMLGEELNNQHSARLEWTIIWLIVIEVILHLVTDIFKIV
jgi:uncharacterized Rmd1/YagE family protein